MSIDSGTPPSENLPAATAVALAFLDAMERRDLDAARRFVTADFTMCFPGGVAMRSLADLVERSSKRYRSVGKTFERLDHCRAQSAEVVYCSGRLHGVWLDGRAFSDIRFIDRFELADGLIRRQDVWNDMGEALADRSR